MKLLECSNCLKKLKWTQALHKDPTINAQLAYSDILCLRCYNAHRTNKPKFKSYNGSLRAGGRS